MRRSTFALWASAFVIALAAPPAVSEILPAPPPLSASPNVEVVGNVPGSFAGLVFQGQHAYATGWATGLTVFDVSDPLAPAPVGQLPLPHFENEDVDVCGDTLLIANDRLEADKPAVLFVVDISTPASPTLTSTFPLEEGDPEDRGAGHIANFVNDDCDLVWLDGGNKVQVVDLSDPAAPVSLGEFVSAASQSEVFDITHDTEKDDTGTLWSVGGGGIAGYRLTDDPLAPELVATSTVAGTNPSPYNDFIMHNSQRRGSTLLVTEEDYVDTDETPPGGCRGEGKFETWRIQGHTLVPLDTWETEAMSDPSSKAELTVNCSSHWFDERDGIAAVGWYEQGVRFLDVTNPKRIEQVGYYLPVGGSTWAAYWVPGADGVVYTTDVYRGIDVLRVGDGEPVKAPTRAEWYAPQAARFQPSEAFGWACPIPVA